MTTTHKCHIKGCTEAVCGCFPRGSIINSSRDEIETGKWWFCKKHAEEQMMEGK